MEMTASSTIGTNLSTAVVLNNFVAGVLRRDLKEMILNMETTVPWPEGCNQQMTIFIIKLNGLTPP